MEFSSSFRAKPIDRLVQPTGGIIMIVYSLLMPTLPMEMRLFLIAVGAIAIVFGLLYHLHKVFKIYDDRFAFKKTPVSPSLKFRYEDIESVERVGGSKLKVLHMHDGETKRRTL